MLIPITEEIREAAGRLLLSAELSPADQKRLEAVAKGTRKRVDGLWWEKVHRLAAQPKLDKLAALADPERNPEVHEREAARKKLERFAARRPPGSPPLPPPLPSSLAGWDKARRRRNREG